MWSCRKTANKHIERNPIMKNVKIAPLLMHKIAVIAASALYAVLFICANTNSCCMVYQPEAPAGLERFSKIR